MCECFINIHLLFFFFFTCVNALPACIFVYYELACCPVRADEGVSSCGPPHRCWELSPCLLLEEQVLLTAEPSV